MTPVRVLLRRLFNRRHDQPRSIGKHSAQAQIAYLPLRPWQVRERRFTARRRGLDPAEISAFLHRVADELAVAQTALAAVREENVRIKDALRA